MSEMVKEAHLGRIELIFDYALSKAAFDSEARFLSDVQALKICLESVSHFIVCIGGEHGFARFKTAQYLQAMGLRPLTLIHARSFVEPTAEIGEGCQVMPSAVVHKFSTLGSQSIVNTNATIDHECVVGNGVHVMGNAAVTGMVTIGDYASIGSNATVLPRLNIGEGAIVGAGAVVTKNVSPFDVVVGVPARSVGRHEPRFREDLLIELMGE